MQVKDYNSKEYAAIFQQPYHVFNSAAFNQLTADLRQMEVQYLAFKTSKHKLGIIGAVNEQGVFKSPFSAPFGGFSFLTEIGLQSIDECVEQFIIHGKEKLWSAIELTLPPLCYAPSFISKVSNSLYRKGFTLHKSDLNYSIHPGTDEEGYTNLLQYNAQKNWRIAQTQPFAWMLCESEEDRVAAYNIIAENRTAKGYPLRMSYEIIRQTGTVIGSDFFLVKWNEVAVAAALVFHVAVGIVQVVYWGDLMDYAQYKTMNYLSYQLVQYYRHQGIHTIDIGPSTEDSEPNYGLCDFKESIGCMVYPKTTWRYETAASKVFY